jgi:hypothetical protein
MFLTRCVCFMVSTYLERTCYSLLHGLMIVLLLDSMFLACFVTSRDFCCASLYTLKDASYMHLCNWCQHTFLIYLTWEHAPLTSHWKTLICSMAAYASPYTKTKAVNHRLTACAIMLWSFCQCKCHQHFWIWSFSHLFKKTIHSL